MAWDSSRTVPWRRLCREWLIYVAIASVAITVYYVASKRSIDVGLFSGLLASGPMYVIFGAVLAKLGYQRKTFKDLRGGRAAASAASAARPAHTSGSASSGARVRPAPTKRTSTGPSQHRKNNKPKRR